MDNEISRIRKVPLTSFIDVLLSLYKRGVEYVDIVHLLNEEEKDTVGIQFTEEYMHKNFKNNAREDVIFPTDGKITEDDLNDLI